MTSSYTAAASFADVGVADFLAARATLNASFFAAQAERIADVCALMAERFAKGGRLIALGCSPAARSDVRHVTVEFVHPVIVGKRALPAIGIAGDGRDVVAQTKLLACADDIVLAFASAADPDHDALGEAIAYARARGCLTIAVAPLGAEIEFEAPRDDPFLWQEIVETMYHVLWELVHVFFEHGVPGAHGASSTRPSASDPGRSAFLYPFLREPPRDWTSVAQDVARSVVIKASEIGELRRATLGPASQEALARAANLVRERLDVGGTVLAFGNGGSATDAMDLVADLRHPPRDAGLVARAALDLSEDSAILTALANDVGPDVVFARQLAAYGRPGDVAVGFSTSGSSRNVIAALDEARRRGMFTIAFVGYDGGRIVADMVAEHVVVAPSQYVPRIQEAHATAYHALRTLVG